MCKLGSRVGHGSLIHELAVITKCFEVASHDILGLIVITCGLRLEVRSGNLLRWQKVSTKSSFCTFVPNFSSRSLQQVNIWPLHHYIGDFLDPVAFTQWREAAL